MLGGPADGEAAGTIFEPAPADAVPRSERQWR